MTEKTPYTTKLSAGLGLTNETKTLLELWKPGMTASQLEQSALASGRFPTVTARRVHNIVGECFASRYLARGESTAANMKQLAKELTTADLQQFMFLFTCRANPILYDFVRQFYWSRYAGGYTQIANDDAKVFVERGIDDGKTSKRWTENTIRNVAGYLTGCCADYGLLERGQKTVRRITNFRIASIVVAYLAYELHFAGIGDSALLLHEDWHLFGLDRDDVLEELKRLTLKGLLIVQAAGEIVRISWKLHNMEALCDVLTQS